MHYSLLVYGYVCLCLYKDVYALFRPSVWAQKAQALASAPSPDLFEPLARALLFGRVGVGGSLFVPIEAHDVFGLQLLLAPGLEEATGYQARLLPGLLYMGAVPAAEHLVKFMGSHGAEVVQTHAHAPHGYGHQFIDGHRGGIFRGFRYFFFPSGADSEAAKAFRSSALR